MPIANQAVRFIGCTTESYNALGIYDQNTLYFCTDTQQIFLGNREYTKSVKILDAQPTSTTVGENGRLYVYNGNMYMCQIRGFTYFWTRVANVNDDNGTVTNITVGSGLDGGTITESGTISHAVPTGASAKSDNLTDRSLAFGEAFQIVGVQTDEFGHVTSVNLHNVILPNESKLAVSSSTETAETLPSEGSFEVVTSVSKGTGSHDISFTKKTYKLPIIGQGETYTIETGVEPGTIKLVGSSGDVAEAVIKDWDKLAKITDITSIFHYKGKKASISELPTDAAIGDVWYVEETSTEYVYLGSEEGWEEFGPSIDLTPYAKSADVIQRVAGKQGQVPMFTADGTLSSTGHTLDKDVPADAVFTDTVYTHPTHTPHGLGLYKVQIDGEGHVTNATQVLKSDITGLGIPGENTDTQVTTNPNTTSRIYITGTVTKDESTGELQMNPNSYINSDGSLTAPGFHGKADSAISADSATEAARAIADVDGNNFKDTYATKQELSNTSTVWEVI